MDPKKTKKTALTKVGDNEVLADAKPIVGAQAETSNTNVEANNKASAGEFDYSPKKMDGHGSTIKQEVIAKAISGSGAGSSGSGFTPYGANMRSIPYSGADARIIDNASGTPAFNKSDRSDSRYGQKTDNTARHINYVPSETYLVDTDGPKPLSESADRVQGALGHPANEFARIQKCSEAFPGAINFERSVDEITDECLLYCEGQQVKYEDAGDTYDDIDPSKRFDVDLGKNVDYKISRSNYVPRKLHVKYDNHGRLADYYYDEDHFTPSAKGDLVAERAATHIVTAANRAEIDRQAMAAKAGNEVEDTWCPIPFGYPEPTKDVLYMTTIEKMLGANVFVPIKMSAKAHSYALNKAAKDGMRPESGGVEIGLGPVAVYNNSRFYDNFTFGKENDPRSIFNRKFTSKGAPSAIVAMMDSIAKYHNRGDMLTQPRSFNMVLKQGLSNYKTFKIDPEFARVFDNVNVFSTIDRSYDPSNATCIMDTIGVSNPYSWNELGSCFRTASVSILKEQNLNQGEGEAMEALYLGKVVSLTDTDALESGVDRSYLCTPPQFLKLASNVEVDDVVWTEEMYQNAAKVVRKYATTLAKNGKLFTRNYAVPYLKQANTEAERSNHVVFAIFNFSDHKIGSGASSTPDFSINWFEDLEAIELTTENVTINNATYNVSTQPIYNEYLAVYYKNRQNYYYLELRDPYTDGIKTYLRRNYGLLSKVVDSDTHALEWPVHYSTKTFSAYSYLVMLSLQFIQEQRSKSMLDVLNYSNNFGYPFSDCDDTGSYTALGGVQYGQSDIFELLEVRQMTPAIALRWTHPELFGKLEADSGFRTLMPFYMNEDGFDFSAVQSDGTYELSLNHERASMSYPVTKSGIRWGFSDSIYGFSERDVRLLLDMLVTPPNFHGEDSAILNAQAEVYKYSQANDGLVIVPSDVSMADVLNTARELGYISSVVGGYLFPEPMNGQTIETNPVSENFVFSSTLPSSTSIAGHSAFRVICWVIEDGTPATDILASGSSIITRASNFTQKYYIFKTTDENPGEELGLCLSTGGIWNSLGQAVDNVSAFKPFTDGMFSARGQNQLNRPALITYAKGLWTRLQKMPFSYNPFDFGGTISVDPFSFNYLFGFLGFRASDFKEDIYNRLTTRMAEGWKFISDPFVEASLLVK